MRRVHWWMRTTWNPSRFRRLRHLWRRVAVGVEVGVACAQPGLSPMSNVFMHIT